MSRWTSFTSCAIAPEAIVVVAYGRIIPPWMLALPKLGCITSGMDRCCRSIAEPAPIQVGCGDGRCVYGQHVTMLRYWKQGWIQGRFFCSRRWRLGRTGLQWICSMSWRTRARRWWWWRRWLDLRMERSGRKRRIMRSRALRHCSTEKTGGWTGSCARHTNSTIAGGDFSRGPGHLRHWMGKKLIVHRAAVADFAGAAEEAGEIRADHRRMFVACAGETWLELIEVQLEGKKRITAGEFLRGTARGAGRQARLARMREGLRFVT